MSTGNSRRQFSQSTPEIRKAFFSSVNDWAQWLLVFERLPKSSFLYMLNFNSKFISVPKFHTFFFLYTLDMWAVSCLCSFTSSVNVTYLLCRGIVGQKSQKRHVGFHTAKCDQMQSDMVAQSEAHCPKSARCGVWFCPLDVYYCDKKTIITWIAGCGFMWG